MNLSANDLPNPYCEPDRAARIELAAKSFERLIGRPLVDHSGDVVRAMWNAPFAILAHGVEGDPTLFFGNQVALARFETDVASFIAMPSRLTAEAPLREERQALLNRVTADGYIDDYAGIRISAKGHKFQIENAIVWNIIDEHGVLHGQSATFAV